MKISVVTVAYNAASTIADTLKSVALQSHTDIEHIIVDGASTDDTLNIVNENAHPAVRIISEPDNGLYDAMNKGVAAATGDFIGFLNADDFYCRSDALSLIAKTASQAGCEAVSAAIAVVNPRDIRQVTRAYDSLSFRPWMLRFGHMPPHPGFYVRRDVFLSMGFFETQYRIGGDFDWMVRFFLCGQRKSIAIRETVVGLRQGGISTAGFGSHVLLNREACSILRRRGYSVAESLIWMKYVAKIFQWIVPAFAYPPPPNANILHELRE
jgi:glycosyltransferase involved in cell wall biosynthesis